MKIEWKVARPINDVAGEQNEVMWLTPVDTVRISFSPKEGWIMMDPGKYNTMLMNIEDAELVITMLRDAIRLIKETATKDA